MSVADAAQAGASPRVERVRDPNKILAWEWNTGSL
jgi:hypothetical protein